ncbi:MAG: hypothetical protein H6730_24775 [Deltaproteobacteria bacterium]|nr:hypothetical protein [Deltaproteobacteria bacterium]
MTEAAFDTVRARTAVLAFGEVLSEILDQRIRGPLDMVAEQLVPVVGHIKSRLETAEAELEGEEVSAAKMSRALGLARSAYPKADRTKVRRARARFRRGAQPHLLVSELSRVIEGVPTELTLLPPGTVLDAQSRVDAVPTWHLDFGRRAEGVLLERLVPRLTEELEPISDLVAVSDLRFDEVVQMAVYGVELAAQQDAPLDAEQLKQFRAALERARHEAEALEGAFTEGLERVRAAVEGEGAKASEDLAAILGADSGGGARVRSQVRATRRAIRQSVEAAWKQLQGWARWALRRLPGEGLFVADAVRRSAHLDAAAIKAEVDEVCRGPAQQGLPPLYDKLFSLQPAEDLRLAVAHRDVVDVISKRVGQRGSVGARVLVVGEHGSGRTTLLNALELRHQRQRTLRLDAIFHLRNEGLVSALAAELGSVDDDRAVVSALNERPTLVLVDDLERHVTASEAGARELRRFASIVVETQATTGWVVTSTSAGMAALETLGPVAAAFAHRITLAPLDPEQAQAAVEARARLAGTRVTLPRPRGWLGLTVGRQTPESEYYRDLVHAADGNLRAILQRYLLTLRPDGEAELVATRPERAAFSFVSHLGPESLAILGLLLRFGPHDPNELARSLWMDPAVARLFALNLEAAGLLERPGGSSQELFYIPPEVEHTLARSLRRMGIMPREGAP